MHKGARATRAKQAQHAGQRDDGLRMRKVQACTGRPTLHIVYILLCWLCMAFNCVLEGSSLSCSMSQLKTRQGAAQQSRTGWTCPSHQVHMHPGSSWPAGSAA